MPNGYRIHSRDGCSVPVRLCPDTWTDMGLRRLAAHFSPLNRQRRSGVAIFASIQLILDRRRAVLDGDYDVLVVGAGTVAGAETEGIFDLLGTGSARMLRRH